MSLRNKTTNSKDSFNLDDYLEEKSSEEFTQKRSIEEKPKKPSNFLRNAALIAVASLASVLWYYDWNPRAAVAGLFGGTEPEVVIMDIPTSDGSVVVIPNGSDSGELLILDTQTAEATERALARTAARNAAETARATERAIARNAAEAARAAEMALARNAEQLVNAEEIERLTQQALRTAFEALEGLEFEA